MTFEFDALLFDLDGTLVNSLAAVDRAWTALCDRHRLDASFVVPQIHGRRSIDSIRLILPHVDAEAEDQWLQDREATDTEGVFALEGAAEFLYSLECPWAIVTSGTSNVANPRIRAGGLPMPRVAVYGEDVKNGKPSPGPYLLGAQRLGIAPERCLFFEDTLAGIRSAHAANMKSIGIASSLSAEQISEADAVINDYKNLSVLPQDGAYTLTIPH